MDPPPLDPKVFKSAIKNYSPVLRDFFSFQACTFSNYTSISQGEIGDCWLLAPLAAISRSRLLRHILISNFTINSNNTYTVRLYNDVDAPIDIIINGKLFYLPQQEIYPSDFLFAGQQHYYPELNNIPLEMIWYAFIEKAASLLYGGYHLLDGGDPAKPGSKQPDLGFLHLTGKHVETIIIGTNTDFAGKIKNILDAGAAIVYTTKTNKELPIKRKVKKTPDGVDKSGYNLLEDHAYVLDSITTEGYINLYNPHGEFAHLAINKAIPMPLSEAIFFGKRLDILIIPKSRNGGRRSLRIQM
jgi:hypothetical protein